MRGVVCMFVLIAMASAKQARLQEVMEPIPGQYIVVLKDAINLDKFISSMEVGAMARGIQTELRYTFGNVLNGFSLRISDKYIDWLLRLDGVDYIEQAGVVRPHADQVNPPSWGLDRVNQADLPLDQLYSYTHTGSGINVYVIDTGIRTTHNDFGGRAHSFYDFSGGDGEDCNGHGTHCSGTVGGATYGVAKDATLYNVRVFGCSGGSSVDVIIKAMDYVRLNGATPAVVSMSLGGSASSAEDQAAKNLHDAGFVVVTSAGNDNADACLYSPARAPDVITVGATTSSDVRSSYSNYGSCLDIFAPGSSITSAWYTSNYARNTISGTSMACPHVSGACAKVLESNPSYSPTQVASMLIGNSAKNKLTSIGTGSPNNLLQSN